MPSKKLLAASAPERGQSPMTTPPTSVSSVSAPANELHETLTGKKLTFEDSGGISCSLKRKLTRLGGRPVAPEHQIDAGVAARNSGARVKAVNQGRKNFAVRSSKNVDISPKKKNAEGGSSSEKESSSDRNSSSPEMEEENEGVMEDNEIASNYDVAEPESAQSPRSIPEYDLGGRRGARGFELRKRKSTVEKPEYVKQAKARESENSEDLVVNSSKKTFYPYNKGIKFLQSVEFDGADYSVGDDVYVKRKSGSGDCVNEEDSDDEVEDCRLCSRVDKNTKLECDGCLGGFHLSCLDPPLEEVPEGDWFCPDCSQDANSPKGPRRAGRPAGRRRTARERLLCSELWAARIRKIWRRSDGDIQFRGQWFIIPEETELGRQPNHGSREVFLSNHFDTNGIESIHRQCWVMIPEEFDKQINGGDDVFMCQYLYDTRTKRVIRVTELDGGLAVTSPRDRSALLQFLDNNENGEEVPSIKKGTPKRRLNKSPRKTPTKKAASRAASSGEQVAMTPEVDRGTAPGASGASGESLPMHKQGVDATLKPDVSEVDNTQGASPLLRPLKSLLFRTRQKQQIESILTDSMVAGDQSTGTCLYISGGAGTGKTTVVQHVIQDLQTKVETNVLPPFKHVTIDANDLAFPEYIYMVLLQKLVCHADKLDWQRALAQLEREFFEGDSFEQPVVVVVDGLDALVTLEKSVLRNILEWPLRVRSRLILIGIGYKSDLPELALPEITSHTGVQKIDFAPYSQKQLEQIASLVLDNAEAYEDHAIEMAAREVKRFRGDAKRTLHLCEQAAILSKLRPQTPASSNEKTIKVSDVKAAIAMMYQSDAMKIMTTNDMSTKIFLVAMVYEHDRTSIPQTTYSKIFEACATMCEEQGEDCPSTSTLTNVGMRLSACKLLICDRGDTIPDTKIRLSFPSDDVAYALKYDQEVPWLRTYLTCNDFSRGT